MTTTIVGSGSTVVVAKTLEELELFARELQELASQAIEPNVFYEPWMIRSAIQWLASDSNLRFVLVFRGNNCSPSETNHLVGFFPLEIRRRYKHLPVTIARLWRHKHCHLCVPLLRQDEGREALSAFFDWILADAQLCDILEFGQIPGVGQFLELLVEVLGDRHLTNIVDIRHVRPLILRAASAEAYLSSAISSSHRKDTDKKERRLRRLGNVRYVSPCCETEAIHWIERFITLEGSGWKGRQHVALASSASDTGFFRQAMIEAWRMHKLELMGLQLNDDLIAIKVNLRCKTGSFAYKISYDEVYSSYSPGLLLEIENIRRLHADLSVTWMDSCADPNNQMFNRIWNEKKLIETLLISNGSRLGDFWVGMVTLSHLLHRVLLPCSAERRIRRRTGLLQATASSPSNTSTTPTTEEETYHYPAIEASHSER